MTFDEALNDATEAVGEGQSVARRTADGGYLIMVRRTANDRVQRHVWQQRSGAGFSKLPIAAWPVSEAA